MKENRKGDGFGRRSFLKYTTAATAGLTGIGMVSAGGPKASQARVATGSRADPITQEQIEATRRAAMDEYLDRGGERPERLVGADPVSHPGGEIVSYVYQIGADGVPRQYAGIAGDTASVGELQRKAHAKADQFETESVETDSVSTQASYWDLFFQNQADFCKDPYGCVNNNFEIHKLYSDGDSYDDAYACKQVFAMEPGALKYGSGWENHVGKSKHDWAAGDHGGESLAEWDPLGTHDGEMTISVSVGTGGAGLGWSYTQPAVTTIDKSSASSEYAMWREEFNSYDARHNTNGMKPGSSCWVNDQYSGAGKVDLMKTIGEGKFRKTTWCCYDYYTLTHTWNLWIEY